MHQSSTLHIGMDVHKEAIAAAYLAKDHEAAVIHLGPIGTRYVDIDTLIRRLQSNSMRYTRVWQSASLA
jgi:hypothetical protein